MKRVYFFLFSIVITLAFPALSTAAPKKIAVEAMEQVATIPAGDAVTGMHLVRKNIYLYGNTQSNAFVRSIDAQGAPIWSLVLDLGGDEIATAATSDSTGNLWIAGSASGLPLSQPTPSPTQSLLNPDGVLLDEQKPLRGDLTTLVMWKISPAGELLSTFTTNLRQPLLVRGIVESAGSLSIVGLIATTEGTAGLILQSNASGLFGRNTLIGKSNTEVNSIIKKSDGSFVIAGSSSENLSGKALSGLRDGIIASVSSKMKVISLFRSSNTNSARSWQNTSSSFFFGGDARTSGKSEAVVTKFGSNLVPTWTVRFASAGPAIATYLSSTAHAMTFSSTSAITGVTGWKASKGKVITLFYDAKWSLVGAYSAPGASQLISVAYSKDAGLLVLASGQLGVSIFHPLTR